MREMGQLYLQHIGHLTEVITRLADELEAATRTDDELRRLCTVPGIGPVTAGAIAAFAPDHETFDSGRNFLLGWVLSRDNTRREGRPASALSARWVSATFANR